VVVQKRLCQANPTGAILIISQLSHSPAANLFAVLLMLAAVFMYQEPGL
jgi:hypothetical protein